MTKPSIDNPEFRSYAYQLYMAGVSGGGQIGITEALIKFIDEWANDGGAPDDVERLKWENKLLRDGFNQAADQMVSLTLEIERLRIEAVGGREGSADSPNTDNTEAMFNAWYDNPARFALIEELSKRGVAYSAWIAGKRSAE